ETAAGRWMRDAPEGLEDLEQLGAGRQIAPRLEMRRQSLFERPRLLPPGLETGQPFRHRRRHRRQGAADRKGATSEGGTEEDFAPAGPSSEQQRPGSRGQGVEAQAVARRKSMQSRAGR